MSNDSSNLGVGISEECFIFDFGFAILLSERFYYSIIHVGFVYQYRGYQLLDLNALKINLKVNSVRFFDNVSIGNICMSELSSQIILITNTIKV